MTPTNTPRPFYLGLNMSGAVSAGAYTAGVMDYLIDAIDTWYAARDLQQRQFGDDYEKWTIPHHTLSLVAMSGASAGGMVSAITSAALCQEFVHVRDQNHPATSPVNALYQSWVRDIDIQYLLAGRDLAVPDSTLVSLLDSTRIDEIADQAVTVKQPLAQRRAWVADGLKVILTLTNLGGIPYAIESDSGAEETQTLNHADSREFEVRWDGGPASSQSQLLTPASPKNWDHLAAAAKATGAFPLMLAPRILERTAGEYNNRQWRLRAEPPSCERQDTMPPLWGQPTTDDFAIKTLNVDGGVTNNSPFDCAHNVVLNQPPQPSGFVNPRGADVADRAVVSVAPFLTAPKFDISQPPSPALTGILGQLLTTLIGQSRIQGENINFTRDPKVFSRWAIAPSIASSADTTTVSALACGSLSAFGGFIHQAFRDHDYQLGRRNCQWFLKQHFALPFDNAFMSQYYGNSTARKKGALDGEYGVDLPGGRGLAIIPVLPAIRDAVKVAPVQIHSYEADQVGSMAMSRLKLVAQQVLSETHAGWLARSAFNTAWSLLSGRIQTALTDALLSGLKAQNLLD